MFKKKINTEINFLVHENEMLSLPAEFSLMTEIKLLPNVIIH